MPSNKEDVSARFWGCEEKVLIWVFTVVLVVVTQMRGSCPLDHDFMSSTLPSATVWRPDLTRVSSTCVVVLVIVYYCPTVS